MDSDYRQEEESHANNKNNNRDDRQKLHHEQRQDQQPSSGELLEAAKIVADATGTVLRGETNKLDKKRVADAAGDLIDAVQQYAKLDENQGLGKYVEQAENYLHQYSSSSSSSSTAASTDHAKHGDNDNQNFKKNENSGAHPSGGGGGGFGDVMKMAQSFMESRNGNKE